MDTNGVRTISATDGTSTPQHNEAYHKGYFLSEKGQQTEIDGIRGLLIHEKPGVVSFLAGKPNPHTFPFESIVLNLKPPLGHPEGSLGVTSLTIDGSDLDSALQYGPTSGLPKFRALLEEFQSKIHNRPQDPSNWTVTTGGGSQDMMVKTFTAVLNPGDPLLVETPVYAGVIPALRDLKAKMIEVSVDEYGLSATHLEELLSTWPADQKRPKVVYTVPVGCNPSGCSHSIERKRAVLEVCKKYNLLIMEDDPYYFLAQNRTPSYFEIELEYFPQGGHVVRFDSFSKLLSAGLRLGFATGPKEILHSIDVSSAGANLHTSGASQAIAYRLMQHWGLDGFLNHAQQVANFYADRREKFEAIARKHLEGLATWNSPVAGMFLWIDLSPAGVTDSFKLIRTEALAKGVLAIPGYTFYPNGRKSSHVRTSFSLVDLETEADEGFRRLAEAIKEWQRDNGKQ